MRADKILGVINGIIGQTAPRAASRKTKKHGRRPMPKKLLVASREANAMTALAKTYRKGRSEESMMEHSGVHNSAAEEHAMAAQLARSLGFLELADHHEKWESYHHEKSNEFLGRTTMDILKEIDKTLGAEEPAYTSDADRGAWARYDAQQNAKRKRRRHAKKRHAAKSTLASMALARAGRKGARVKAEKQAVRQRAARKAAKTRAENTAIRKAAGRKAARTKAAKKERYAKAARKAKRTRSKHTGRRKHGKK